MAKNWTNLFNPNYLVLLFFFTFSGEGLAGVTAVNPESKKAEDPLAATWVQLNIEKRCEGLLKFFTQQSAAYTPDWNLIKPQCIISGSVDKDTAWSFEASWQRGARALPLKYVVSESRSQKPRVIWCVVKGKKSACAAPWDNAFEAGDVFATKEDGAAAFQGILKLSQGFLTMATKLDEWVSKSGGEPKIFDLSYAEWVVAWSKSKRSLPVKKEVFQADYKPDDAAAMTGLVIPREQMPMELRECLGCAKTSCEKAPMTFVFWGLGLTIFRETTPDERQATGQKSGRATWVMLEPTPFVGGQPKWPFLCGAHRMSIQKL